MGPQETRKGEYLCHRFLYAMTHAARPISLYVGIQMIDIPRLLGGDVMPAIGVDGCMLYKVFEPKV
jgi:hypothetical protein